MNAVADNPSIVIAGAGSIGCYVGGRLLEAGRRVRFLGRDRIKAELAEHGLQLTRFDDTNIALPAADIKMSSAMETLAGADIILVAVKSGNTAEIGEAIAAHAPAHAVVVSLQNGVTNADRLSQHVGDRPVVAGMVPFNVAALGEGRFHQGTSGTILIAEGVTGLRDGLNCANLEVETSDDMPAVMWGKLMINLNNALNALSGLPLKQQLENAGWRGLMADQIAEAMALLKAAGIKPKPATPLPPALIPFVLRLPTPIFRIVAAQMIKIDPLARSSMWEDLDKRRSTEIDELQGAALELAGQVGMELPLCARVAELVKAADAAKAGSPGLSVEDVRAGV
ncbi:2-dehydropantoate 2-reductase [Maricaulis sp.]|uniref:2-dehydropantoate 2-reductase n=1 Tax=Maricaulis sp. TaxID=1486257 RepID=UPI00261EE4F1|nr:2-dehydropantoate 2-reductase [Maricaulis sp.]